MSVIINPGTGPVGGATKEQAEVAIAQFVADLGIQGIEVVFLKECYGLKSLGTWPDIEIVEGDAEGRYSFKLTAPGRRECEVDMPGLPVERVRYLGNGDQNIWDFPRLCVDGSSWVWCYAINCAKRSLTGEDDDE